MPPAQRPALSDLAEKIARRQALPAVVASLCELGDQPQAAALGAVLRREPSLAEKLTQIAGALDADSLASRPDLPVAIETLRPRIAQWLAIGLALADHFADQLNQQQRTNYWAEALPLAVAARLLAQRADAERGAEAFTVSLLQGIGKLALLGQFSGDDVSVLTTTESEEITSGATSNLLEHDAVGFESVELSAALAKRWGLPVSLIAAIEAPRDDSAELAPAYRLAAELVHLVVGRELDVMGPLLERIDRWAGISARGLNSLVSLLQSEASCLASALEIDLGEALDYRSAVTAAHARLALSKAPSAITPTAASQTPVERVDEGAQEQQLLLKAEHLHTAVRSFLADDGPVEGDRPARAEVGTSSPPQPHARRAAWQNAKQQVLEAARELAADCRAERTELTLCWIQVRPLAETMEMDLEGIRQWISENELAPELALAEWIPLESCGAAILLPGHDRHESARLCGQVSEALEAIASVRLDAGVAGVHLLPAGFDAADLIEAAVRCLEASIANAKPTVKSIEVF